MYSDNNVKVGYEKFDECYGIIEKKENIYLKLDNGEKAFAFNMSNFRPGTRVLCSIKKLASVNKDILVSIDSVIEYAVA